MFDRAWIENELAGLIVQLHQTEGAILVLQQMLAQLDQAETPALTLDGLQEILPEGVTVEGEIKPHENQIHT